MKNIVQQIHWLIDEEIQEEPLSAFFGLDNALPSLTCNKQNKWN